MKTKRSIQFVDWSPAGFKFGLNPRPVCIVPGSQMAKIPKAACMIANTTAIAAAWAKINYKFDVVSFILGSLGNVKGCEM